MPTRNRMALLRQAVASVLQQTYEKVELIVVDDASSDGTGEYLDSTARQDPRLVLLRNSESRGGPASRNSAILKSKGDFVTGLDDDDQFLPARIEEFVRSWVQLRQNGVVPSCLYAQDIYIKNGVRCFVTEKRSRVKADDMFESNYIGNQIFAPRSHFIDAGLFDERMPAWQDLEFFIRVMRRFGEAHLVDKATYLYDASPRGDRIASQEEKIRAAFDVMREIYASNDASLLRALFLQLFQKDYHISPDFKDWARFFQWGGWPKGLSRLMRATVSNRLSGIANPPAI